MSSKDIEPGYIMRALQVSNSTKMICLFAVRLGHGQKSFTTAAVTRADAGQYTQHRYWRIS